jgi:hypothetical protein
MSNSGNFEALHIRAVEARVRGVIAASPHGGTGEPRAPAQGARWRAQLPMKPPRARSARWPFLGRFLRAAARERFHG